MYQQITIVGNLGKDPEMRYTPQGKAVTSFSVATSHQYTGAGGETVKETAWFRVSVWGKQAEVCNQYLAKGSKVLVTGRLTADPATGGPRMWKNKDGDNQANFEINGDTVRFLDSAKSKPAAESVPEDDIPF